MHRQHRAEIHSQSNHIDEKQAASSLHSSPATLACGDGVDLPHATSSLPSCVRHHLPKAWSAVLAALVFILWFSADSLRPCLDLVYDSGARSVTQATLSTREAVKALSEVFQVYPPVLTVIPDGTLEITDGSSNASVAVIPSRAPTCQQTLVVHSFALSYGVPYVGTYQPPSCSFNRVTWNLTVASGPGRQFDRLGSVYFGDIELFRTSTAEPSKSLGIEWTYLKDMTNFLPLFKTKQTIIFDLGNLIDDVYTAAFNVTLTASFFTADDSIVPADLIVPISNRTGDVGQASVFHFPDDASSNSVTLPRNIKKAIFTISATGQAAEEFWYTNVLQSQIYTFNSSFGEIPGFSPFREVQLFIDGQLAGVAWPFPIIFTGGIVPGFWRPIVGIDAFDLKEDEIDITPWLPLLCDGKSHAFSLKVSGLNDSSASTAILSETVDDLWWLSGKIFVWLDEPGHITTGSKIQSSAPGPDFQISSQILQASNGTNETLIYHVAAQRKLSISSTVNFASGSKHSYWTQSLSYTNSNNYSGQGNISTTSQQTTGYDLSSNGYAKRYDYPLYAYSVVGDLLGNLTIYGIVKRAKDVQTCGQPVFPTGLEPFVSAESSKHERYRSNQGASLYTSQTGTAYYTSNQTAKASFTYGTTEQDMSFSGAHATYEAGQNTFPKFTLSDELFKRHVLAVNGTIIEDEETLIGVSIAHDHLSSDDGRGIVISGMPGRGGMSDVPGQGNHNEGRPR